MSSIRERANNRSLKKKTEKENTNKQENGEQKMVDEKKRELLKKLQELAERGVGGEKEGAQKKLEQLMKKYGIKDADLSEDKEDDYDFKYHNQFERKLLIQIFYKIVPDFTSHVYVYRRGKGSKSTYCMRCTKAQALQIQIEFEFYSALWEKEAAFFLEAFIQKHRIFGTRKDDGRNKTEMTREEKERMMAAMSAMQDKSMMPMIEEKEE